MVSYLKFGSLLCFLASSIVLVRYFQKTIAFEQHTEVVAQHPSENDISNFVYLVTQEDKNTINKAITTIDANWEQGHDIFLIEALYFTQHRDISKKILSLLERKTNKKFGYDFDKWFHWMWNKEQEYPDSYFQFKSRLHELIDPKFGRYFLNREKQSTIRLDEVRWGGVLQDGIPPLRNPRMIAAEDASYLKNNHIVFGIEVNGDARAYPKRILAWHEMFVDTVGDTPVAGVYCTLCGTVILYKTTHNEVEHQMGTSGFLYRSNKLMYDQATQSLWSTLEGEPVIGPLVGKGIKLDYLSVVTTTWGEWKKRHPETSVLSLQTGHRRDYGEGVAYQEYFATDNLMFTVPKIDKSLRNKDEILSIRIPGETDENIAIASRFLKRNTIYQSQIGTVNFVVFTDTSGAHRVYRSGTTIFESYDGNSTAIDNTGNSWHLSEEKMTSETDKTLKRLPTHNAFWFGYKAAFPDTRLIK